MTAEAKAFIDQKFPGVNHEEQISKLGICDQCKNLPPAERKRLADKAKRRALDEARRDLFYKRGRPKYAPRVPNKQSIDLAGTVESVTFPPEVWEWLDLLGYEILFVQVEATSHEGYLADTDYKRLLVRAINRDISSVVAIYTLLRLELIHQAAGQVRLFCESVITLRYIANDIPNRLSLFLNYAHIEAFEIIKSALEAERHLATPNRLHAFERVRTELEANYRRLKPSYVFTDRWGKERPFRNWCNLPISQQATKCGKNFAHLYDIVYSELSAYVHGSQWSLRRQLAYSDKHYDPEAVLVDIATIVRKTITVWEEWARFCDEQLGWELSAMLPHVAPAIEALATRHATRPR